MFRKGASLFCTICNKYSMEKIEDERAFLFTVWTLQRIVDYSK